MLVEWICNLGGQATLDSYKKLLKEDKRVVLDFLEDLPLYEEFKIN
ncbi:MAG: hypothetical protein ACK5LV_04920 [Lachnospirales bacterium]